MITASTSSTISPPRDDDALVEEDEENRVTKTSKKFISTEWILENSRDFIDRYYENMYRK